MRRRRDLTPALPGRALHCLWSLNPAIRSAIPGDRWATPPTPCMHLAWPAPNLGFQPCWRRRRRRHSGTRFWTRTANLRSPVHSYSTDLPPIFRSRRLSRSAADARAEHGAATFERVAALALGPRRSEEAETMLPKARNLGVRLLLCALLAAAHRGSRAAARALPAAFEVRGVARSGVDCLSDP